MTYEEAQEFVNSVVVMRENVPDNLALKCKGAYPTFKSLCNKKFVAQDKGFKFRYQKNLYKTVQPNTAFVEHYKPGVGTESMFEKIDEKHSGAVEDPIPYSGNMRLEPEKHYIQNGVIYKCTRDTEIAVHNSLADLVGIYVQTV